MRCENLIRAMAGTLVLTGLALTHFLGNQYFLFICAFVGINLLQSAFTGFCPAQSIFKKLGMCSDNGACCSADGSSDEK